MTRRNFSLILKLLCIICHRAIIRNFSKLFPSPLRQRSFQSLPTTAIAKVDTAIKAAAANAFTSVLSKLTIFGGFHFTG